MAVKKRYTCIFRHPMIRTDVNPRLASSGKTVPYGAFMRIWRQVHCPSINPYGSDDCPYRPEDCVLAYWKTAQEALDQSHTSPIGLFRILARRRGYDRAENKPLAREREQREAGPGRSDHQERQGLPRASTRPTGIGEVLGSLDLGARQRRADPGETSTE